MVLAGQKSNSRCRVALQFPDPDVFVALTIAGAKRQALAVGRKARKTIEPRSRVQGLRPAAAVQPEDRPLKLPLPADVDEGPGLGKGEIPAGVLTAVDVFYYRLGLSGQRQPANVERRCLERFLLDPDQMPAGKVPGEEAAVVQRGPLSGL